MVRKMKTKGFLICFTGIDGSGKTTLSKALVEMLNKNSIKCKYVYGRIEPFISRVFIWVGRKLFLRGKDAFGNYIEYSNIKRAAMKRNSFLSTIYQNILLFDYSLQLLFKIRIPLILGKNIVCDRYVYDTIIDLSVDMEFSGSEMRDLIKKLFYIAPKPDIVFLIDLLEEIAFQRKKDTPSIEYLKERRKAYFSIINEEEIVVLDGSKSLDKLKEIIQNKVAEVVIK